MTSVLISDTEVLDRANSEHETDRFEEVFVANFSSSAVEVVDLDSVVVEKIELQRSCSKLLTMIPLELKYDQVRLM